MTDITRETLELAALAAGHVITSFEPVGANGSIVAILGTNAAGYGIRWRPHTDIADAARLAVRLRITPNVFAAEIHALELTENPYGTPRVQVFVKHNGTQSDMERAYCRAITLCAAEIGRRMKEAK